MEIRCFYSLHRETYSVTAVGKRRRASPSYGFYSLHRETYSVTPRPLSWSVAGTSFLFAASRDVQRDGTAKSLSQTILACFYSLHRETYSVTRPMLTVRRRPSCFYSLHRETYSVTPANHLCALKERFLFAASRDVQRDDEPIRWQRAIAFRFYSLHRETYSVTWESCRMGAAGGVSIRCIARRTA